MLQVYSTLTRKKEAFHKKPGEAVSMYVCGPTVYKPSHIGHMVGPVLFDTVKRYLTYLGYKVTWVVNITDVDDKLIARAKELATTVPALADKMTQDYFGCLKQLNVTGIDHFPKATEHIGGMLAMIGGLIDKGYAYAAGGDVYFDVAKDADYGKLCNRDPEQLEAGSRIEVSEKKRNPGDFALWKGAKPGEPAEVVFDSPWGKGRPGWHIECSAMATKILGDTLDIHGGGLDLQFPHHENELAQSESATGREFAKVWMHNGLLKMGSAKMAGSVGNVVNITDLLQRHSAETVRFLILSTHYRSPIEYSEERLEEVKRSLDGFHRFFEQYEQMIGESFYELQPIDHDDLALGMPSELAQATSFQSFGTSPLPEQAWHETLGNKFLRDMDDDFNTGGAIGTLFNTLRRANQWIDRLNSSGYSPGSRDLVLSNIKRTAREMRTMANILGLFWKPPVKATLGGGNELVAGLMQLLLDLRANLRTEAKTAAKDNPLKKAMFDQTDLIRKRLGDLGIALEDRPTGTTWRIG